MSLTWLHISDFHIRTGDPYDRDVVLRALVESVADYAKRGRRPDLIFATGDIAFSGQAKEYLLATKFFDELLGAAGLDKRRLFVIPGNHDVDRDAGEALARTLESREQADKYFQPERLKPHLALKLRAFLEWHNSYFDGVRIAPDKATCGPVELVEINGHRLGILPMNSALFCQGDDDHDKLWIGRRCLETGLAELSALKADLHIGLIHHPLEWLHAAEGVNIQAELEATLHILLRGHLHETRIESTASAEGELLRCAAGAAYQTRKWPMRALYATLADNKLTIFPIRYEDSPRPIWTTDSSAFPRDPNHERTFAIPGLAAVPVMAASGRPKFRSNIEARGNRPFVGREDLMGAIGRALGDPGVGDRVVVLHGHPGVGKSELAREFARRNRERYPGGAFWIDASGDSVAIHLARIGQTVLDVRFAPDLPLNDQGLGTFHALGGEPTLLIYDNVESFDRIKCWLPFDGMKCHAILTTLLDSFDPAWHCLQVDPLSEGASIDLVRGLADEQFAKRFGGEIAKYSRGLPVQIVPETTTLLAAQRRGRTPAPGSELTRETGDSFERAYARLDPPSRLLLHAASILNPQRIPRAELARALTDGVGWSEVKFVTALEGCLDLHVLEGVPDPGMHQLLSKFLQSRELSSEDQIAVSRIRKAQRSRFVELARAVAANPADSATAATFISYPSSPMVWEELGVSIQVRDGSAIGRALYRIGRFREAQPRHQRTLAAKEKGDVHGRFDRESLGNSLHWVEDLSSTSHYEQARPWFERVVAAKEKGDVHGRIDHQSLGDSLHRVGHCLSSTGQHAEARLWFERAVAAKEQGDLHGHIDYESLGRSQHLVGYCLSSTGRYEEARLWFERAVAEKGKGDVHGRIDYESLSLSLHLVGDCLSSTGQYGGARMWYERAVAAAEKGDVHGRIDNESLGISLHAVGDCLSSTGQYEEARQWFERAVAATEKGDVHGRIDHEGLGCSLHQVGYCLASAGKYEEARPWFERAVAAAEKGDVHGRIDQESLGCSLHLVGYCLSNTGQHAEARSWFERALAAKEKGDIHGRVDHDSLRTTLQSGSRLLRKLGDIETALLWEKRASELTV